MVADPVRIEAVGAKLGQPPERANCRLRNNTRTGVAGAVSLGLRFASRPPTAEVGTLHRQRAPRYSRAKHPGGSVRRPTTLVELPAEHILDPPISLSQHQSIKPLR